jgi:hypothetical protein
VLDSVLEEKDTAMEKDDRSHTGEVKSIIVEINKVTRQL